MRPALLAALVAASLSGCAEPTAEPPSTPAVSGTTAVAVPDSSATPEALFGRVWLDTDSSAARGSIRVFLPDQTVLTTSCTEVYRIDRWRGDGAGRIVVTEDAQDIPTVVALDGDRLTLTSTLVGGETTERVYRPADVPALCPDLR